MSETVTCSPPGCCGDLLTPAEDIAVDAGEAAGWEAWERSLGAGLAADRLALGADPGLGDLPLSVRDVSPDVALEPTVADTAELAALRDARQAANVPLAAPGVRPDAPPRRRCPRSSTRGC